MVRRYERSQGNCSFAPFHHPRPVVVAGTHGTHGKGTRVPLTLKFFFIYYIGCGPNIVSSFFVLKRLVPGHFSRPSLFFLTPYPLFSKMRNPYLRTLIPLALVCSCTDA